MFWAVSFTLSVSCFYLAHAINTNCTSIQFTCDDGECIDKIKWCDSSSDCRDDSDEHYCHKIWGNVLNPNKCRDYHFKCNDGVCIPKEGKCDGLESCEDKSDEEDCDHLKATEGHSTDVKATLLPELKTNPITESYADKNVVPTVAKPDENVILKDAQVVTTHPINISHLTENKKPEFASKETILPFSDLDVGKYARQRSRALKWLLLQRDENFGWGEDTQRALVALHMSNFSSKPEEKMLMSKQLHLQLSVALVRNVTSPIPFCELALYINALFATCFDAKNFHGVDLLSVLRHRVDAAHHTGAFVSPTVYLTLCLGKQTNKEDVGKILELTSGKHPFTDRTDIQALATLAASCIVKIPTYSGTYLLHETSRRLIHKVRKDGLPGNIYEAALVTQALNEAKASETYWNRSQALELIFKHQNEWGTFGDILATYYVLPIISGKSLASLGAHCNINDNGLIPIESLKNSKLEKTYVHYTLRFGSPVEVSQTIILKVAKGTNFFNIMRLAGEENPKFKCQMDYSPGVPVVYSIGGITNDAERGMFWSLYTRSHVVNSNHTELKPFHGDIRQNIPTEKDENVFWYKTLE